MGCGKGSVGVDTVELSLLFVCFVFFLFFGVILRITFDESCGSDVNDTLGLFGS
jgi:hypothetical protein